MNERRCFSSVVDDLALVATWDDAGVRHARGDERNERQRKQQTAKERHRRRQVRTAGLFMSGCGQFIEMFVIGVTCVVWQTRGTGSRRR